MTLSRAQDAGTPLIDGRVLVTGGTDDVETNAELYDPVLGLWFVVPSPGIIRTYATALLMDNGKVLVAGGVASSNLPTARAQLFEPSSLSIVPPSLTSVTPSSATVGAGTMSVILSGSNFVANSYAKLGQNRLVTTYLGSGKLMAFITSDRLGTLGQYPIQVVNPVDGAVSESAAFAIVPGANPIIISMTPNVVAPGTTVAVTVSGANLAGVTSLTFAGTGVTAIVGAQLNDTISLSVTAAPDAALGSRTITLNISTGLAGSFSGFIVGTIPGIGELSATPPGLSQDLAPLSGNGLKVTVIGSSFVSSSTIVVGQSILPTTFVSSTQLTADVPSAFLKTPGPQGVKVVNPGALESNLRNLTVVERGDVSTNRTLSIGDALILALAAGGIRKPVIPDAVADLNLS